MRLEDDLAERLTEAFNKGGEAMRMQSADDLAGQLAAIDAGGTLQELWSKVGDGVDQEGGILWGY